MKEQTWLDTPFAMFIVGFGCVLVSMIYFSVLGFVSCVMFIVGLFSVGVSIMDLISIKDKDYERGGR